MIVAIRYILLLALAFVLQTTWVDSIKGMVDQTRSIDRNVELHRAAQRARLLGPTWAWESASSKIYTYPRTLE